MSKDFKELVENRRSCHCFDPNFKITADDFFQILEYVRLTPSGYNAQPWEFVLAQDPEILKSIYGAAFEQNHLLESGNVVVVFGNLDFGMDECGRICEEWRLYRGFSESQIASLQDSLIKERPEAQKREMVIRNASLAAMTFLYAAEDLGFITCPMMGFSHRQITQIFKKEENFIPILMIALGKPHREKKEPPRLPRKKAQIIGRILQKG